MSPIRPSERARYPRDWRVISARIRERAAGRCECPGGAEGCGLHRGRRCEERQGEPARWAQGRVALTVAHLDHAPENCDPASLHALCQRCHLRYDTDHHRQTRSATREARRRAAGQLALPERGEK